MKAKKLTSILLILAIVLTLGISALATDPGTGTITINAPQDITGRTFEAYLLFEVDDTYTVTENGVATQYYNYVATDLLKEALSTLNYSTNQEYVEYVAGLDSADRETLAALVNAAILAGGYTPEETLIGSGTAATVSGVPFGYYIIIETSTNLSDGVTPMLFALDTTNIEIDIKSSFTTFEKTVRDALGDLSYDTDFSVGDTVYYALEATSPYYYDGITEAWQTFEDTLGDGLLLDADSIKLTIGGDTITLLDPAVSLNTLTPNSFILTIYYTEFSKIYPEGTEVLVTYNATITTDAVKQVGDELDNTATLDFSNNPTTDKLSNGVTVYTYGFDFLKKNPGDDLLAGAQFELSDEDGNVLTFSEVTDGVAGYYVYNPSVADPATITSNANGVVDFYGLDEGIYYLEETEAPSGYNLLDTPIKVTITAEKDSSGYPTGVVTYSYVYGVSDGAGGYTYTGTSETTLEIINYSGIELPSTGGIGTIMFGIFGCLIIVGGATGITMLIIKLKRRHVTSR